MSFLNKVLDVVAPEVDENGNRIKKDEEQENVEEFKTAKTEIPKKIIEKIDRIVITKEEEKDNNYESDNEIEQSLKESIKNVGKEVNEFISQLEELKDVLPDVSQRVKVACKVIKTDKDTLLKALSVKRDELDSEHQKFITQANAKNDEVRKTLKEVNTIDEEITNLTARIQELKQNKQKIQDSARNNEQKIKDAKLVFKATVDKVNNDLEEISSIINKT